MIISSLFCGGGIIENLCQGLLQFMLASHSLYIAGPGLELPAFLPLPLECQVCASMPSTLKEVDPLPFLKKNKILDLNMSN